MKAPRYKVEELPARWRVEAEALLKRIERTEGTVLQAGVSGGGKVGCDIDIARPVKKRLRQSPRPLLNELERRFLHGVLEGEFGAGKVWSQAVRLELARGLWYKPDFFVPEGEEGRPTAYEVKGPKVFRGGFENLKMAARVHRWVRFVLVWEGESGKWERQEVLP